MADFAPLKSAEYTSFTTSPRTAIPSYKWGGKMRASSASLTFTGAGTGTAKMLRLPAGKVRVHTDLSYFVCPQGGAGAEIHLGYAAHVSGATAGLAVVADDNAFLDNGDIASAALATAWVLPAVGYFDFDSADGVDLEVMIDTGDSAATGEMWVLVVYSQGN